MKKRRNYATLSLALLFFAILGLNIWVIKSTAHTNTVIDKTVIEHAQLEFFIPGKRILMQATILDPAGVAEARLYFGTSKDAKKLVFSPMKHQGGSYVGIIPAPSSKTEKIFYCFLAVNHNGDVIKTGLFELHVNKNIGFVPTWQGDFDEYGKTLILGKEPLPTVIASEAKQSLSLEGFTDSIIVNSVKPDERYFAAKKVERVPGLSTIDGGDVEPSEEAGEVKGGWSKNKKIAVIGGGVAAAVGGGIAAALAGGGGGGGGGGGNGGPPPKPKCTFSISPTSWSVCCEGGTTCINVNVTGPPGCKEQWTAKSKCDWVTITSGQSGSGNGQVCLSVPKNPTDTPRTCEVTIAGNTYTVTQEGCPVDCTFSISPTSWSVDPCGGGTTCINVTTQKGCDWTAQSNVSWVTITSGQSGCGSGQVCLSALRNPNTTPREGTVTIAGNTYNVTQAFCPINVSNQPFSSPGRNIPGGLIKFTPPTGAEGAGVRAEICFDNRFGIVSESSIRITISETKTFAPIWTSSDPFCADLGQIFKFTSTPNRIEFFVHAEAHENFRRDWVKFHEATLQLDF